MAAFRLRGKLYTLFTVAAHDADRPGVCLVETGRGEFGKMLVGLGLAMFVALFGWGSTYFGWSDPEGKVQLALFTCFVLGTLCGYKSKG